MGLGVFLTHFVQLDFRKNLTFCYALLASKHTKKRPTTKTWDVVDPDALGLMSNLFLVTGSSSSLQQYDSIYLGLCHAVAVHDVLLTTIY